MDDNSFGPLSDQELLVATQTLMRAFQTDDVDAIAKVVDHFGAQHGVFGVFGLCVQFAVDVFGVDLMAVNPPMIRLSAYNVDGSPKDIMELTPANRSAVRFISAVVSADLDTAFAVFRAPWVKPADGPVKMTDDRVDEAIAMVFQILHLTYDQATRTFAPGSEGYVTLRSVDTGRAEELLDDIHRGAEGRVPRPRPSDTVDDPLRLIVRPYSTIDPRHVLGTAAFAIGGRRQCAYGRAVSRADHYPEACQQRAVKLLAIPGIDYGTGPVTAKLPLCQEHFDVVMGMG